MEPIKCACGYIWTDEAIKKGYTIDEISKFYYCPIEEKEATMHCGTNYVDPEGGLFGIYQKVRKRHKEILRKENIDKTQNKHKYTLDVFDNEK